MNDETTPTEPLEASQPAEPAEPPRRRLLRSRNDRMIAGVAGGLGRYFAVDPVIFRIGFAVSVFFGGLGALAYIALVLFVPVGEEGEPVGEAPIESSRGLAIGAGIGLVVIALSWGIFDGDFLFGFGEPWFFFGPLLLLALGAGLYALFNRPERETGGAPRSRGRSGLAVAAGIVLALCALCVLGMLALASAWAGATGHGVAVGGAVVLIGALLALSAFRGRGARWLIVPAVAIAVPLGVVSAADVSFGDGVGEREYEPSSIASLPEEGYELGIGRLVVDLRELDWSPDSVVDLDVNLGIGEAIVAVPENVCVGATLDATGGELEVAGSEADGIDAELHPDAGSGSPPRLNLTGEVDFGVFRVINDDDVDLEDLDRHWRRFDDDADLPSDDDLDAAMEAACAVPVPDPPAPGGKAEEAGGTSGIRAEGM